MKQVNYDKIFAYLATIGVVIGVVAGFWLLGSPLKQRQIRADQQRVQDFYQIALYFYEQARESGRLNKTFKLPKELPENKPKTDPITGKVYDYQRINDTEYKLCTEFGTNSNEEKVINEQSQEQKFWQHPSGQHCFQFDVLKQVDSPGYYY